jgi:hypothetical protein
MILNFIAASLWGLAFVVQGFDAPDNNSHWSLRNAGGHANPSNGDIAQMMISLLDRVEALETHNEELKSTVQDMQSKLDKAVTLHRFLQTSDAECLPQLLKTDDGDRRCIFDQIIRFDDKTFFNAPMVVNDNIEFDSDADCMPIFNATSKQCVIRNNYTFDAEVEMRNKTIFTNESYVKFEKKAIFEDDVYIQNSHKTIDFVVDDKVNVKFQPDHDIHIYQETTFYDHVKIQKDLHVDGHSYLDGTDVDGNLNVKGHSYMRNTDVDGDLDVSDESSFHGRVYANKGVTAKFGVEVKTGMLDVKKGGARIYGHVTMADNALVKGDFEVLGAQIYSGDVVVDGHLTVNDGARINSIHKDSALYVDGKSSFRNDMDVTRKITAGAVELDGANDQYPQPLFVHGDGKFTGIATALKFDNLGDTPPPVPGDTLIDVDIDKIMVEISKRVLIIKNVFIDTEDPDNEVITTSRLKTKSISVESIEANTALVGGRPVDPDGGDTPDTLVQKLGQFGGRVFMNDVDIKTLVVEESAKVGQDEILTTADAESMAPAGSTNIVDAESSSCTCSQDEIRAAVNRDYIRKEVDGGSYSSLTANNFIRVVSTDPYETETLRNGDGGGDCTCSDSQITGVVDKEYIESLGITPGCGCTAEGLGINDYVEEVVNGMTSTPSCNCPAPMTTSQVEEIVEAYRCDCPATLSKMDVQDIAGNMGFLTTCPCQ